MKTKSKSVEIPQKPERQRRVKMNEAHRQMTDLRLVRPARLKSEVHRSNVRPQRKPKKYG